MTSRSEYLFQYVLAIIVGLPLTRSHSYKLLQSGVQCTAAVGHVSGVSTQNRDDLTAVVHACAKY